MEYIEKAKKYFEQKYHCSQAVLAAFAEELGLTEEQALKKFSRNPVSFSWVDECVNHRQIVLKQSSVADKSSKGDL